MCDGAVVSACQRRTLQPTSAPHQALEQLVVVGSEWSQPHGSTPLAFDATLSSKPRSALHAARGMGISAGNYHKLAR